MRSQNDEDSIKGRHRGLKPEIITGDPKLEAVSSGYTKDHSGAYTPVALADGKTVGDPRTDGEGSNTGKNCCVVYLLETSVVTLGKRPRL